MLPLYLGCLIVGMGLLAASFVGGDADADVDADVDLDADHDVAFDGAHAADSVDIGEALWLPLLSLRFWIFFVGFFGLTGTLLHFVHDNPNVVLGVSLGLGFGCGYTASRIVRALRAERVNSAVDPRTDYVGKRGVVLLSVEPGDPGQVRINVKGGDIDLPATASPGAPTLGRGDPVVVVEYRSDRGDVVVEPFTLDDTSGPLSHQRELA